MRATIVVLTAVLAMTACGRLAPAPSPPAQAPKIAVVASFYPLYEFARRVGGEFAEVRNLVPAGAEPHDYEPTPQDVAVLHAARLVIYNGAGFEPWIEKLLPGLPAGVESVNATEGLPLVRADAEHDHGPGKEPKDTHGEKALDPHVWLDPVLAQQQVDLIAAAFVRVDPDRRTTYEANAAVLKDELAALDERYRRTLAACRRKTFITSHAAFGYLASRYGLTMVPISGLSPEAEPPAARLRAVVRAARAHRATVIYFETLVSPRVAETIAREVRARTAVLNPLEGLTAEEQAAGATYVTVMDANLRSLADGLDCR
ncbi:MAG: zinc ABC transporter substrate-binding protein [Armatimonadota bacterium]|nr:zinc ABC transporter substrate-binding protein [Armatimonadota bacterium]MDR7454827.1 zinc ABC transporter substrate-binding protein [Armatimonadota bacterium]MDR7457878.1 zinc ABC transporter substrate-binding protein [Armatimonadota bacterium]